MKTALILGVSGQDGAYLARLLLEKQYAVHGTSRDAGQQFTRLDSLGVRDRIAMHTLSTTDRDAMRALVASIRPDEIYNLSGLSSVALSFRDPASAWGSIADAQRLVLDVVRDVAPAARVYHSASSECFGDVPFGEAADERTPFAPRSPYAEAKVAALQSTADARARGTYACSGLVFNHESPLRGDAFVTTKIVHAAAEIAAGTRSEPLQLGDVSSWRDWGYAPEYVDAMWRMLQQDVPEDLVIATGESHTVEELATATFAAFGLDAREHVRTDDSLRRAAEIRYNRGNPTRARQLLGWEATTKFHALVQLLADAARHP